MCALCDEFEKWIDRLKEPKDTFYDPHPLDKEERAELRQFLQSQLDSYISAMYL